MLFFLLCYRHYMTSEAAMEIADKGHGIDLSTVYWWWGYSIRRNGNIFFTFTSFTSSETITLGFRTCGFSVTELSMWLRCHMCYRQWRIQSSDLGIPRWQEGIQTNEIKGLSNLKILSILVHKILENFSGNVGFPHARESIFGYKYKYIFTNHGPWSPASFRQ